MAGGHIDKIEELNEILSESRETLKRINEHKDEAARKFESIKKFCNDSEVLLGVEFHEDRMISYKKRAGKLQKEVVIWGSITVFSLLFLSVAVLFLYKAKTSTITGFGELGPWGKYLFAAPVIYLTYLASKNYDKARGLQERYEYKTVILNSLPKNIQLLKKEFSDSQKDILEFALEKMNLIFKEPYNSKKTKRSFFFKLKNIFNSRVEEVESTPSTLIIDHPKANGVRVSRVKVVEKKSEQEAKKTQA